MRVGTVLIRQIESENRSNHQVGENEQNVKQLLHKIHTPSRPSLEWQGKLGEAQSAGRDCPGSGAAGPLAATAWTVRPPRQDILRFACPYSLKCQQKPQRIPC